MRWWQYTGMQILYIFIIIQQKIISYNKFLFFCKNENILMTKKLDLQYYQE